MHVIVKQSEVTNPRLIDIIDAMAHLFDDTLFLERKIYNLFPDAYIYKGHTHWRIFPYGKENGRDRESIYLDLCG